MKAILLLIALSAPGLPKAENDLSANERLWNAASPRSYAFIAEYSCFCPVLRQRQVLFEIDNGEVVRIQADDGTDLSNNATVLRIGTTVPEMFSFIREVFEANPVSMSFEYDEVLGYPTQIYIDYTLERDTDLGFRITQLLVTEE